MTVIRDHASLSDAWEVTHPAPSPSIASTSSLSPTQAVEMYGVTADSPLNTYSAGKSLDVHARTFRGKRLDYIFFRDPAPPLAPAAPPPPTLVAADARVLLTDPVPGLPFSYSDHFGVSATLHIKFPQDGPNHTMFYVGFVHGRWEANALLNVIDDLELYRKSVEVVATAGEFEMSIKP